MCQALFLCSGRVLRDAYSSMRDSVSFVLTLRTQLWTIWYVHDAIKHLPNSKHRYVALLRHQRPFATTHVIRCDGVMYDCASCTNQKLQIHSYYDLDPVFAPLSHEMIIDA